MSKLKFTFAFALALGLSTAVFAGNPKTETKEAAPTEVKSEAKNSFIYYVTSRNPDGTYSLSETPPLGGCPDLGPDPCQISTDSEQEDLTIDQEGVDLQTEAHIDSKRTL